MKLMFALAAIGLLAAQPEPWANKETVEPKTLADRIQAKDQLTIFYVGFPTLYRNGAHVQGATLAGPCSKAEGLDGLKKAAAELPREKELFIYCGCCPFVKCPNIRPAYSALHDMGFSHVRVVKIETNLHTDWIEKGYPAEKTTQ